MAKRNATTELNHDNWNEEDAPEEAGTFKKATADVMQNRVIKSAKRRSLGTPETSMAAKSPFAAFGGFKATSSSSESPSPFSFLSNTNNKTSEETSNGKPKESSDAEEHSAEYYSSLKGLNQCVSQWIKSHVDKNPFCILTPIFKDYERYLAEIDEKEAKRKRDKSPEKPPASSAAGKSESSISKPAEESTKKEPVSTCAASSFTTTTASSFTTTTPKFNFGSGASTTSTNLTAGFTFASSSSQKPFTFSNVTKPEDNKESGEDGDEEEEPAKVEFKPVVEDGAVYSKRCKVFVKKDSAYQERGVGMLYVKPVGEKTQLIVRADTSLGNVILNTLLTSGMPIQRMGKNNVMMVCIPTPDTQPPPVPVLLRLKTSADADEALEKLKAHMK